MKMRDMMEALESASVMEARGHDDSPAWTPGQAKQAQRAAAKLAEAIRFMESGLKALKRTQVLDDAHGNILDAIHGLRGAARHLKAAPFEKTRPGGAVVAAPPAGPDNEEAKLYAQSPDLGAKAESVRWLADFDKFKSRWPQLIKPIWHD